MPSPLPRWDRLGKLLVPLRVSSSRRRPSPLLRRLGSHITLFEACSTFTRVTACVLADSPKGAFSWSASADLVTSFHRSKCYRQEQPVAGRGSHPLELTSLSRHTESSGLAEGASPRFRLPANHRPSPNGATPRCLARYRPCGAVVVRGRPRTVGLRPRLGASVPSGPRAALRPRPRALLVRDVMRTGGKGGNGVDRGP